MRWLVAMLSLALLPAAAPAAEIDYSNLVFPQDAREIIADADHYGDTLEYLDDKTEAAVKRLYAARFIARINKSCRAPGFWSELMSLPTTAGVFLNERRANKDLDDALPHARYVREALRHGAASIGEADAEALLAQGICERVKP